MNTHNTSIIKKPWGYEYLLYKNDTMSLWLLNIKKGEKTSMHCHPSKTTGLVVISGKAEINFISDKKVIQAPGKQMIRRGLFHQTCALTDVLMIEAETPIDKDDLVRLHDDYGRKDAGYESSNFEVPKTEDCLWLEHPKKDKVNRYEIGQSILLIVNADDDVLKNHNDEDIVMVLQGGLIKKINSVTHNVIVPGDVGLVKVVKHVANEMDGWKPNTVLMFVKEIKYNNC